MSWTRPTLNQLVSQALAYFQARLTGADTTLRRSNIVVTAKVFAGLVNQLYGFLDWIVLQLFVSTADDEYVLRHAAKYAMAQLPGKFAAGTIIVAGVATTPIPINAPLTDNANWPFQTTAAAVIGDGGTVSVPVVATRAGAAGNDAAGTPLSFVNAIAGVNGVANVDSDGLSGGDDQESIDGLRARVEAREKRPPQGGTEDDYVEWAEGVSGVTRAWAVPLNRGPGTVDVAFVMDGRSEIIPLSGDLAAVQAAIDAVRPVTDDCIVFAPDASAVNFTISGTQSEAQPSIRAALAALFGANVLAAGLLFQEQVVPAVASGAGTSRFTVVTPSGDIAGAAGTLLTLGTVTFT